MSTNNENQISTSYVGELSSGLPGDVFLVESDEDFVLACNKLSQREGANASLKIWVRSKNHFAWIRDFIEQIGCSSKFEEKTPRLVLAELWNVSLPEWLSDSDILEYKLLEMNVDSQKQTLFEYRLLTQILGTVFQPDILIADHLVEIIKTLVIDDAKAAFEKYPFLHRCLETKCQQWANISTETWVKDVCRQLSDNSAQLWQWLSLWSGLHSYPEKLLEFVLTPEQILLVRKVPPRSVEELPLDRTAKEQIETQIETFFKEIGNQINSSTEFLKVLERTSGRLIQEYQFTSNILKSNQFPPTEEDVQRIRDKFRSCPGISENQLKSLIYLVKPGYPALPGREEEWSIADWIRWTTKEYAPYRSWQVHSGYYDEDLEQAVVRFSDWYISEYTSIHKDPDLSLVHCLRNISLNNPKSEFSIILLIDCLPISYLDLLDGALRNIGLSRHDLRYRFAALPTTTENNKTALLSGEWQNNPANYETILKARSTADWNDKTIVYHSNLRSLSNMTIPQDPTIAVINYIDVDEVLHSHVESKNTTYEDELYRLFARIAESVQKLSHEWIGPREHFNVFVITDHGACRILEEETRSFDSEVVNKLFANEKHRFAALAEDQLDKIPENLWTLGYRFKQPFKLENVTYFLPKGHNTVRQARSVKGHMHGGVTPEEVIVPTALYKLVKVVWKTPSTRFLNLDIAKETGRAKFYIQRVVTLEIEIQNPNTTDINILRASVISPEADLKSCEIIKIPAESANTFKMNCYFKKDALDKNSLEIKIVYEIAGEQRTHPIALDSDFKSALSSGFSLKDL